MRDTEIIGALGDLVGHWNALAEEDADSRPSGELSDNIAVAHGQSLAFGTAARELSGLLERCNGSSPCPLSTTDRTVIGFGSQGKL
jgi:hypothetical protein